MPALHSLLGAIKELAYSQPRGHQGYRKWYFVRNPSARNGIWISHRKVWAYDARFIQFWALQFQQFAFKVWFSQYSYQVLIHPSCKGQKKIGYVIGATPKPTPTIPNDKSWDEENSIVMAWLIKSMKPKIDKTYLFYKTAKETQDAIQEIYLNLEKSKQCFEVQ